MNEAAGISKPSAEVPGRAARSVFLELLGVKELLTENGAELFVFFLNEAPKGPVIHAGVSRNKRV